MKQKRRVSMIGVLVLIISALVLITGCSQPNGNKGNTGNNGGGNSQNSLDGLVASEGSGYYYFSNHQVFWAWNDGGIFKKKIVGSYTGNTFYEGTGSNTVTITATDIILDNGVTMKIISDSVIIAKIKNASEE